MKKKILFLVVLCFFLSNHQAYTYTGEKVGLTVKVIGRGKGSVVGLGMKPPMDCSNFLSTNPPCKASVPINSVITLDAQPRSDDDVFKGWQGDRLSKNCQKNNVCTTKITGDLVILAEFGLKDNRK